MARVDSFLDNRRSGFAKLEWTLIGGGLAAGLIGGAMMLTGQEHSAPAGEPEPARTAAAVKSTDDQEQPGSTVSQPDPTDALEDEIRELRSRLEKERMRNEIEELRRELAGVQSRGPAQRGTRRSNRTDRQRGGVRPAEQEEISDISSEADSAGQRTLDFWNQMNSIIVQEAAMRSVPTGGVSANNAADFLDRRIASGEFATQALRKLDTTSVDRHAIQLLGKLIDWYADGVKVCKKGRKLLDADPKTRRGPKGKAWQKAEKKHNGEVQEVNALGARVRDKLSKKYGLDFPPLQ